MTGTGTPAAAGRDAWLAVLDELERGAEASARAAEASGPGDTGVPSVPSTPWAPPAGLGPLPVDLADRAARIVRAQLDAQSLLRDARGRVARHLGAVRSVEPARPVGDSVYLDVLG